MLRRIIAPFIRLILRSVIGHRPRFVKVSNVRAKRRILVDVSKVARGFTTGGISRTTISLFREMRSQVPGDLDLVPYFIDWLGRVYRAEVRDGDVAWAGKSRDRILFAPGDIVISLDLSLPPACFTKRDLRTLRAHGIKVFSVVYDLLPITNPEWFKPQKRELFAYWLDVVTQGDGLITISRSVSADLERYLSKDKRENIEVREISLGADPFSGNFRGVSSRSTAEPVQLRMLMVGTVEPRKDYMTVVEALRVLNDWGERVSLTIVGKSGWISRRERRQLLAATNELDNLQWKTTASDEDLLGEYDSHDVLVANSLNEGLGLPLIEAAARGLPVLARDIPVFRELDLPAVTFYEGGSAIELARSIAKWKKEIQGGSRLQSGPFPFTWQRSARELLSIIL